MRVIIAGGRDFANPKYHDKRTVARLRDYGLRRLLDLYERRPERAWNEVVSGGAPGADTLGESFAGLAGLSVSRFPANWDEYGKGAGFIRNTEMAKYADVLVAFWDGSSRGTQHMIDQALRYRLEVHVLQYDA